jgi:hypothetical protein
MSKLGSHKPAKKPLLLLFKLPLERIVTELNIVHKTSQAGSAGSNTGPN